MLLGDVDVLKKTPFQCINKNNRYFILIFQAGQFHLLDNLCPHKSADLCFGHLQGADLYCPWHKASFDINTGKGLTPLAGKGVKCWPLTIKNGQLMADLSKTLEPTNILL